MKNHLIIISLILLTGCATSIKAESKPSKAIADARNAPEAEHLAYLGCYAMSWLSKQDCKREITKTAPKIYKFSGDYARPYDYEAERLGFAAFIRNQGKNCDAVNEGPIFDKEKQVFLVKCTNGNTHNLKYNSASKKWNIEEQI